MVSGSRSILPHELAGCKMAAVDLDFTSTHNDIQTRKSHLFLHLSFGAQNDFLETPRKHFLLFLNVNFMCDTHS